MGGAVSLLFALVVSPRHADPSQDLAEFHRAYDSYMAAWVKGDWDDLSRFYGPKFIWMLNGDIVQRSDFMPMLRNGLKVSMKVESGDARFKSVSSELGGYTVDVVRHLRGVPGSSQLGEGHIEQFVEAKEGWVRTGGLWVVNVARIVKRKVYWVLKSGGYVDVSPRPRNPKRLQSP